MYLEVIAGLEPNKTFTEAEKKQFFERRDDIIREFMEKHTMRQKGKGELVYVKEEDVGCYYRFQTMVTRPDNGAKQLVYEDYFYSDFEYGGGIRKNSEDQRFNSEWKMFIMDLLTEMDPTLVRQYFEEWNRQYRAHKARRGGNAEKILNGKDKDVEEICKIGLHLVERAEKIVEDRKNQDDSVNP